MHSTRSDVVRGHRFIGVDERACKTAERKRCATALERAASMFTDPRSAEEWRHAATYLRDGARDDRQDAG